jgi:hypothetical protein
VHDLVAAADTPGGQVVGIAATMGVLREGDNEMA